MTATDTGTLLAAAVRRRREDVLREGCDPRRREKHDGPQDSSDAMPGVAPVAIEVRDLELVTDSAFVLARAAVDLRIAAHLITIGPLHVVRRHDGLTVNQPPKPVRLSSGLWDAIVKGIVSEYVERAPYPEELA